MAFKTRAPKQKPDRAVPMVSRSAKGARVQKLAHSRLTKKN